MFTRNYAFISIEHYVNQLEILLVLLLLYVQNDQIKEWIHLCYINYNKVSVLFYIETHKERYLWCILSNIQCLIFCLFVCLFKQNEHITHVFT